MLYEIGVILNTHLTLFWRDCKNLNENISKYHSSFYRWGNRPREFKVTSPRPHNDQGVRTKSQSEQSGPRTQVSCHFPESACQLFLFCSTPLSVPGKVFLSLHNSSHNSCVSLPCLMTLKTIMIPIVFPHLPIMDKLFKSLERCARKPAEQKGFCIFVSRSRVVKGSIMCVFTAKKLA